MRTAPSKPFMPGAMLARGQLLTLVYIALTAGSQVFLGHVGSSIPTAVSLFYMALAACVVFNIVEYRNLGRNHASLLRHWRSYGTLSVAFVVNWLFAYYSVTHSSADFFIATFFLSSALCSCVRERRWGKAAATVAALLAIRQLSGFGFGLLVTSALAGIAMYVYYVSSLRFGRESGIGPISVVSVRCYALLACCIGWLLASGTTHELAVSPDVMISLAILIVANMVLPSFLSQTCLQLVGVATFTFMNSLIPMLAFVLQSLVSGEWQAGMLLAVTLATLMLNYDDLVRLLRPSRRADAG
jgi:drug/metabolite transporter (DMT)-like permease